MGGSELLSPTERGDPELAEVTDMSWAVEALPGLAMEELASESGATSYNPRLVITFVRPYLLLPPACSSGPPRSWPA